MLQEFNKIQMLIKALLHVFACKDKIQNAKTFVLMKIFLYSKYNKILLHNFQSTLKTLILLLDFFISNCEYSNGTCLNINDPKVTLE